MKSSIYLLITLAIIYSPSTHTQTQASKELEEMFRGVVNHCEDNRFTDDKPIERIMKKIDSSSANEVAEAFTNTRNLLREKISTNPDASDCKNLWNVSLITIYQMDHIIAQGKGDEIVSDIENN